MRKPNSLYTEAGTMSASFKAAVLVVVMGVAAVAADHAMVRPHETSQVTDRAAATVFAGVKQVEFALPQDLRPNEGDVPPPVATF